MHMDRVGITTLAAVFPSLGDVEVERLPTSSSLQLLCIAHQLSKNQCSFRDWPWKELMPVNLPETLSQHNISCHWQHVLDRCLMYVVGYLCLYVTVEDAISAVPWEMRYWFFLVMPILSNCANLGPEGRQVATHLRLTVPTLHGVY